MPPSSNNLTLHSIHVQTFKKNNNIMQIIQTDEQDDFPSAVVLACKLQLRSCNHPGRCASVPSGFALPRFYPSRFACRCARLALLGFLLIRRNCHTYSSTQYIRKSRMASKKKVVHSQLATAILNLIEPITAALDADFPIEMGHELPSKQDRGLQILIANLCRDVHQQIHGAPQTGTYRGFPGVKDSLDRAEASLTRLVDSYAAQPEGLETDPNVIKLHSFVRVTMIRYEALTEMLTAYKDVYFQLFGSEWQYMAPGTGKPRATTQEAMEAVRAIIEKKKQPATVTTTEPVAG